MMVVDKSSHARLSSGTSIFSTTILADILEIEYLVPSFLNIERQYGLDKIMKSVQAYMSIYRL